MPEPQRRHPAAGRCWQAGLQKSLEFLDGQPSIPNDTTHRECVYRIVPRNSDNSAIIICHDDVLPLPGNPKTSLLQGADSIKVIDTGTTVPAEVPLSGARGRIQLLGLEDT